MPAITDIGVFLGESLEEDELRDLVAAICDALTDAGFATKDDVFDGEGQAKTFIVARQYEIEPEGIEDFLTGVLTDSVLAVIPIDKQEEYLDTRS